MANVPIQDTSNHYRPPTPDYGDGLNSSQRFAVQQHAEGNWGTPLSGIHTASPWAFQASAVNPLQSNAQRIAEEYRNHLYGGSETGAQDFNARVAGTQDAANARAGQLQAQYGGQFQGSANLFGGQAAQAAGRDPGQFIAQRSLGDMQYDRGLQQQAFGGLYGMATAPQGPSAAQAQLQLGTNQAMANQLALARSGRGLGESASGLRAAGMQNAVIQQNAGNQAAMLRAQEDQAFRQRQLAAFGAAGGLAGQMRQGDLGMGQYITDSRLRAQGLNDQTALAYGNMQLNAQQAGAGNALNFYNAQNQQNLGAYNLQNQVNMGALQGRQAFEQNRTQIYGTSITGRPQYRPDTTTPALIGAGGAVLGAAAGSLLAPGVGTAAGAAAGGAVAGQAAR